VPGPFEPGVAPPLERSSLLGLGRELWMSGEPGSFLTTILGPPGRREALGGDDFADGVDKPFDGLPDCSVRSRDSIGIGARGRPVLCAGALGDAPEDAGASCEVMSDA
jgi:hypothetical protein